MEIGSIIKKCRTEKKMTQEELANLLFVSRQLISKWENNKSYPDLNQLILLSDYFDLSLDELMRGDQKMIRKKDSQVKTSELWKKVITIMGFLIVFLILYFSITTFKVNRLYQHIIDDGWEDMGSSYTYHENDIQYSVKKINKHNIFNIPKTLTLIANPIKKVPATAIDEYNGVDSTVIYFNGDKELFTLLWQNGDLQGQELQMDSTFIYKKELQSVEKQTLSKKFIKVYDDELNKDRAFLDYFLDEIDKKWQEINK